MDNWSPFSLPASMQVQQAVPLDREAGEASQETFEQQLASAGEAQIENDAAQAPPPRRPTNIRSVIEQAVQAEQTRRNLSQSTVQSYTEALFRLEKDLRSRGETIAALDHDSLVARAEKLSSRYWAMAPALTALHKYRNPNASDGPRRRYVVPPAKQGVSINEAVPSPGNYPHLSETDRALIDNVIRNAGDGGLQKRTIYEYGRALRSLGNDLGAQGKTIGGLDHEALVWHARTSLPRDGGVLSALSALRKYREPNPLPDHGRRDFPSEEDASLVDAAVQAAAERRAWIPNTTAKYYRAFQNLAKSLQSRGQTIAALDHNALSAHARAAHEGDNQISSALEVLLEYREPAILARRTQGNHPPSAKDKSLIEAAAAASQRPRKAVESSVKNLLRFAGALGSRGQEIDRLDHIELLQLAKKLFPSNKSLISGLGMIRDYRKAEGASGEGPQLASDDLAFSEELRRLLDDEPASSQPTDDLAGLQYGMDPSDQLPTESFDTAEFVEMLAFPGHSPADDVNQPDPAGPRPSDLVDPDGIWPGVEQAGLPPVESLDTAKLLEMLASAGHSPTDSVNQPGAPVLSLLQAVDPDSISAEGPQLASDDLAFSPMFRVDPEELRRLLDDEPASSQPTDDLAGLQYGMDPSDQLPTESFDTAEFVEMLAFPGHSPADDVNQPDPAGPRPSDLVDPDGIWPGVEQAGLPPVESLDTAKLLEMLASAGHSPTDSVNQPGAPVLSLLQAVDPDSISAEGPQLASDDLAFSPMFRVDPEELRRLLDDEPVSSQPTDDLAGLQYGMDPSDQLPTESFDTAEFVEMLAFPGHSPADDVNQPDPAGPRPSDLVDPDGIWPGVEQAGLPPVESLDTAKLLEMLASAGHSPTDSVNQPGAPVPSLLQAVDPDSIWLDEAPQAGRPPTQSLDTAELLEMFASDGHSPTGSVNQP
ncbi:hypothetical protein HU675_0049920 (plasmid) [Bradyrhizobium septentrionale]|uniref:hypothetical protein n=1 Tax=Bradyrhizobium septentrionale TaxID=1404411 RepID=UPI0015964107|nr:hypothetical protein [Bradyrhizobium septentrionale]UGY30255.1 hypothetical protein HU675_0049920 [Bradyrhizobium septentrionale]